MLMSSNLEVWLCKIELTLDFCVQGKHKKASEDVSYRVLHLGFIRKLTISTV